MTWKLARLETDALLHALRAAEPPTSEERARVWNAIQKALSADARRATNDTERVERALVSGSWARPRLGSQSE